MAIAPLQPHSSWYQRFWYDERSPLDTLVERALIVGIIALALLAAATASIPTGKAGQDTAALTDAAS